MVRDVSGALLAGVSVEITSANLVEKVRATTTGSDARYRFLDLPDGTYSVTFVLPGFWMARRDGVTLVNGSSATVDATMRVGGHHSDVIAASHRPRSLLEPTRRSLLAPTPRSLFAPSSVHLPIMHGSIQQARDR